MCKNPIDSLKSTDTCTQIGANEVGQAYRKKLRTGKKQFPPSKIKSNAWSSIKLKFSEQLTQNPVYVQPIVNQYTKK